MPRRAHTSVANLTLFLPPTRVTHAAAPLLPRDHAGHVLTVRDPAVGSRAHSGHGTTFRRLTIGHATIGRGAAEHITARNAAMARNTTVGPFTIGGRHVFDRPAGHLRQTLTTAPVQARPGPSVPYEIRRSGFDVVIGHSRPTSR
ncbi:hypothetical protein ACGFJC_32615 [Nonomuraea fuscirosea]|uniref:hypothetical protein n=1 Tax=Nonomuraea fuscirosea TaxID=1291556 RepID=UPI0034485A2E